MTTQHSSNNSYKTDSQLTEIENWFDETKESVENSVDKAGDWFKSKWNDLQSSYHGEMADYSDDLRDKTNHRMEQVKTKAKAKGYEISSDLK